MSARSIFAPAKLNLFLHVGEKRTDGYHALESLVVFADICDELSFSEAEDLSLNLEGPFAAALAAGPENLVLRAATALREHARPGAGAGIVLTKNLPVASGIGGGSSDAAATLLGLCALWNVRLPTSELSRIAEGLGSDVPVCLARRPSWMEGRGERVIPAPPLPPLAMVLVNPRVEVPTGKIFAALRGRRGVGAVKPARWPSLSDLVGFLESSGNDLEAPAVQLAPEIGDALRQLRDLDGALIARMSGSGATCFAIFEDDAVARRAASALAAMRPGWWVIVARETRFDQIDQ